MQLPVFDIAVALAISYAVFRRASRRRVPVEDLPSAVVRVAEESVKRPRHINGLGPPTMMTAEEWAAYDGPVYR